MLTIKEYAKAESLEQAYQWNQKKSNRIIGGMLWMRLGNGRVDKAIDLSGLGLDQIEETDEAFSIGAMVTLRQLELHQGLDDYTQGAVKESVRHIVGVQFRNLATIGGSLYGRFGFSDVLTMFLAMDSYVELYQGGILALREFAGRKPDNDILVRILVKKKPLRTVYMSGRNTKTDLPVLTCAVSLMDGNWRAVIGARPGRAVLLEDKDKILSRKPSEEEILNFSAYIENHLKTGTNMRGSAQYRKRLAGILVRRCCMQAGGRDEDAVHTK